MRIARSAVSRALIVTGVGLVVLAAAPAFAASGAGATGTATEASADWAPFLAKEVPPGNDTGTGSEESSIDDGDNDTARTPVCPVEKTPGDTIHITRVQAAAPGGETANLNGEYVILTNTGASSVELSGYVLDYDDGQEYTVPEFTLDAGASVTIHTGSGQDTQTDLYAGYDSAVINNDGSDTLTLRDDSGTVIDQASGINQTISTDTDVAATTADCASTGDDTTDADNVSDYEAGKSKPSEANTTNDNRRAEIDSETESTWSATNRPADSSARVVFVDQESNGTAVVVQSVTVPDSGFIVIHDEQLYQDRAEQSVIGVAYLAPGTATNVSVGLFTHSAESLPTEAGDRTRLTRDQTLTAVVYQDTDDDRQFDFYSTTGTTDRPYVDENGSAIGDAAMIGPDSVADDAFVEVNNSTATSDPAATSPTTPAVEAARTGTPKRTKTETGTGTGTASWTVTETEPVGSSRSAKRAPTMPGSSVSIAVAALLGVALVVVHRR